MRGRSARDAATTTPAITRKARKPVSESVVANMKNAGDTQWPTSRIVAHAGPSSARSVLIPSPQEAQASEGLRYPVRSLPLPQAGQRNLSPRLIASHRSALTGSDFGSMRSICRHLPRASTRRKVADLLSSLRIRGRPRPASARRHMPRCGSAGSAQTEALGRLAGSLAGTQYGRRFR